MDQKREEKLFMSPTPFVVLALWVIGFYLFFWKIIALLTQIRDRLPVK